MHKLHQLTKPITKNSGLKSILIIISIIVPFFIAVLSISLGINLWYDNARDLLAAWDNLSKPTLIGPTTGIPGLFYGPYWIWLLSLGMIISKDPILVTLITATIPYFIIFPFIWFKFRKFWKIHVLIIGWLLFMFSSGMEYATQLWNPYPAPLITIGAIYLLLTNDFKKFTKHTAFLNILLGFLLGLIINFHTSFGIGFNFGVALFLLITFLNNLSFKKTCLLSFLMIGIGFLVSFTPFILFEIRHGFNQIQTIIKTASSYGALVGIKGLTPIQIFQEFIGTFAKLIHLPLIIAEVILIICIVLFIVLLKFKKIHLTKNDTKMLTLIFCLFTGISFIYFTAKNPVWAYHFIGVDILFLLLTLFFMVKISLLRKGLIILTIYILATSTYSFILDLDNKQGTPFYHQKELVTKIANDAGKSDYVVIAYSPSIYAYEYTYLFRWLAGKNVPFDPSQNDPSDIIYLITPAKTDERVEDFIHFRSPDSIYKTEKQWNLYGETIVFKKIKK